jgi:hypothetical protein
LGITFCQLWACRPASGFTFCQHWASLFASIGHVCQLWACRPALGITFCQHRACLPAFGHLSMSYVSMQTGIFRKPEYLGSHDILSVP